jgi:low affinity Fe/Cu permease
MGTTRRRSVADRQADLAQDRDENRWRRGLFRGTTHGDDWLGRNWASRLLHRVGELVAAAAAGLIVALLASGWAILGAIVKFPSWWATALYSVTASVTFVMVFVIQHTQTRQISAVQRKLDELLRATAGEKTLIAVEEASDDELQALADLNLDDRTVALDQEESNVERGA